jgi:hypothetical protein
MSNTLTLKPQTTALSNDQLLAMLMAEREKSAVLQAKLNQPRKVTFKVGEKGALSMYGLGRFPVTLYRSQWQTLLANSKAIEEALTLPGLKDKGE